MATVIPMRRVPTCLGASPVNVRKDLQEMGLIVKVGIFFRQECTCSNLNKQINAQRNQVINQP